MPRSRPNRVVSLTKTKSRGFESKAAVIEDLQENCKNYSSIYIFSVENMRNRILKDIRREWRDSSRIVFGKNRVMQIALQKSGMERIAGFAKKLVGERGLLFTNETDHVVETYFRDFFAYDYSRAGTPATQEVVIPAGPVDFQHTMEPSLRQLGLPVSLKNGKIVVERDYQICKKGDILNSSQTKLLEHFGMPLAVFKVKLLYRYNNSGVVTKLTKEDDNNSNDDDDDDDDDDEDNDEDEEEEEDDDDDDDDDDDEDEDEEEEEDDDKMKTDASKNKRTTRGKAVPVAAAAAAVATSKNPLAAQLELYKSLEKQEKRGTPAKKTQSPPKVRVTRSSSKK